MSNFTLVVGGEIFPTSTNAATILTITGKPVVRSNMTGVVIRHKTESKLTVTIPTITSSSKSVKDRVQTESEQNTSIRS